MKKVLKNKEKNLKLTAFGFTLIELLAVIVILAIIALIATPIILKIIDDSKEESNKRSVEMYAKAVENAIANYQLKTGEKPTKFEEIEEYIEYDGSTVVCDVVQIYEDGNIYLNGCIVNNDGKGYVYGEQHLDKYNVKAATEKSKTTGIVPTTDENGNIVPGSEFKIKVSNTSEWLTFFILSNSEDGNYVNLIAEQNITIDGEYTSEPQDGDEWYMTESNPYDNRYGPQKAYTYLNEAVSNWINIPIIENFNYEDEGHKENSIYGYQNIKTELDETTGKYITTITPLSSSYGNQKKYENMRARLPYYSEVIGNTTCTLSYGSCPLWMVNYLYISSYYSTSNKINSTGSNYAYWLLSSNAGASINARYVNNNGTVYNYNTSDAGRGIRPVITILKSDLLRVM